MTSPEFLVGAAPRSIHCLVVNAAKEYVWNDRDDVRSARDLCLVGFGQRIIQTHLRPAGDSHRRCRVRKHLVGEIRQTHERRKNEERNCDREHGESRPSPATPDTFEYEDSVLHDQFSRRAWRGRSVGNCSQTSIGALPVSPLQKDRCDTRD